MSLTRAEGATGVELFARALLGFLCFAFPPTLILLVWQQLAPAANEDRLLERVFAAHFTAALLVLALASWLRPEADWRMRLRTAVRTTATYLSFLVLWMLGVWAYGVLLERLGHPLTPQPHLLYFTRGPHFEFGFVLALVTVTVFGPLAEEIVFRGYLSEALRRVLGTWTGEVLAALLFGLLHGLENALPIAALGFFFALLRRNSGSLAPAALAHILHNSVTVALAMAAPKLLPTLHR